MARILSAMLATGVLLSGCVATTSTTVRFQEPDAYATAGVNLRAGPGPRFPRVAYVPPRAPLRVYGCVRGYSWCDVSWRGERGWISSRYISLFYTGDRYEIRRSDLPVVTFDFDYWDRWYPQYPWYRDYPLYAQDRRF
jgi:uncharacterized protein YraI